MMNQEAVYILNRREYKESSLLLDVISPNYGRISIIANGALKSKKGWSAMLQVFQPLLMIWTGNSPLKTLISVDAPSESLSLHSRRLYSAYYLNELLVKLLPQGQVISNNSTALFINYAKALQDLESAIELEIPLREFEYHLLSDLGVLPDLLYDINNCSISADGWYKFIHQKGFSPIIQANLNDKLPNTAYFLGYYLIKFSDFSTEMYSDKQFMLQVKRLMRILIQDLLGGQELKSRALFQTYQPFRSSK